MRSPDWLDVRQNEGVSMANYAIMRCKKLTGMGSVASALQHCYRERETPNADAERTPENYCSVSQSADEAMGKLRELLPEKRRKDAKLGVNEGAMISFRVDGQTLSLPLVISAGLTAGQVGLPMGMPGIAPVLAGARLEDLQEAQQ